MITAIFVIVEVFILLKNSLYYIIIMWHTNHMKFDISHVLNI